MTAALDLEIEPRRFHSTKSALMFYQRQRNARMGMSACLESGRTPRSREERERDQFSYSRIIACLTVQAPEDLDPEFHLYPRRIEALLQWYGNRSQEYLADELGLSLQELSKFCGFTESIIRRRMQARGLLETGT